MKCAYCGASDADCRDHVVPRSRGGPDEPRNIVMACKRCNDAKGDLLPSEWLDDVPELPAAIEKRISKKIAVRFRDRRGLTKQHFNDEYYRLMVDQFEETGETRPIVWIVIAAKQKGWDSNALIDDLLEVVKIRDNVAYERRFAQLRAIALEMRRRSRPRPRPGRSASKTRRVK